MEDCIFCKIAAGQIPSSRVYEDDSVFAFRDINPQAPVHVLVIPKRHIASFGDVTEENSEDVRRVAVAIPKVAALAGLDANGYRVISNCGRDGGQTVMHLHFHILGGKQLPADRLC